MRHRFLTKQLERLGLDQAPPDASQWAAFIELVETAYTDADLDRDTLERSLLLVERRLRSRDELSQLVVHDLRNLLSAAEVNLEVALDHELPAAERREVVADALGAVRRLGSLVVDLLDVGAAEEGVLALERQPTDIAELARRAIAELVPNHAARARVVCDGHCPPVPVDAALLRRVFENVLANAVRYTTSTGAIEIAIAEGDRRLVISMSNDGPPITAVARKRLFEKYEGDPAHHRAGKARGLGLYFCRMVVEAHGGSIQAADLVRGARFEIALPL